MRTILFVLLLAGLVSCASQSKRQVTKDTKEKRELPIVHYAKGAGGGMDYYLNLRTQNFFDYYEKNEGSAGHTLYAGTYSITGSTLALAFHNNESPEGLTNNGTIHVDQKRIVLRAKNAAQNRTMTITTPGQ